MADYTPLIVAGIAATPATIIALATLVTAIRTKDKLIEVHKEINGRMGELLAVTAESSKAKGVKEESERSK